MIFLENKYANSFISGAVVGALVLGIGLWLFNSRHMDDSRVETAGAMAQIQGLKSSIEKELSEQRQVEAKFLPAEEISEIKTLYQSASGDIIFSTPTGQLMWVHPEKNGATIKWRCLGGSAQDVPPSCRE